MALPDVADTYRIRFEQQFSTDECLNVFYARDVAVTTPAVSAIAKGFWEHIKTPWRNWQTTVTSVLAVRIVAEALFPPYEFGVYSIPAAEQIGLRSPGSSQYMPIFNAAAIKLEVGTRQTRPGSKRIVGLLESDVDQTLLTTSALALIQAIADKFKGTFTISPGVSVMTQVVVGYPTPNKPPPPRVQDITNAVASSYTSHQVSRDLRP